MACSLGWRAHIAGVPWGLAKYSLHPALLIATLAIQMIQSERPYELLRAILRAGVCSGGPHRAVCGNWINTIATWKAVRSYVRVPHSP